MQKLMTIRTFKLDPNLIKNIIICIKQNKENYMYKKSHSIKIHKIQ